MLNKNLQDKLLISSMRIIKKGIFNINKNISKGIKDCLKLNDKRSVIYRNQIKKYQENFLKKMILTSLRTLNLNLNKKCR